MILISVVWVQAHDMACALYESLDLNMFYISHLFSIQTALGRSSHTLRYYVMSWDNESHGKKKLLWSQFTSGTDVEGNKLTADVSHNYSQAFSYRQEFSSGKADFTL